jgi:hypothetical protein
VERHPPAGEGVRLAGRSPAAVQTHQHVHVALEFREVRRESVVHAMPACQAALMVAELMAEVCAPRRQIVVEAASRDLRDRRGRARDHDTTELGGDCGIAAQPLGQKQPAAGEQLAGVPAQDARARGAILGGAHRAELVAWTGSDEAQHAERPRPHLVQG